MSEENVERLRKVYASRTLAEASDLLHPEAEMHQAPEIPDTDDYYGRDEVVRGTARWLEEWEEFRFRAEEMRDLGQRVFVRVRLSGRARGSGATLDRAAFHLWEFRDGMPWRCDVFFSEAPALEAAGLSE